MIAKSKRQNRERPDMRGKWKLTGRETGRQRNRQKKKRDEERNR